MLSERQVRDCKTRAKSTVHLVQEGRGGCGRGGCGCYCGAPEWIGAVGVAGASALGQRRHTVGQAVANVAVEADAHDEECAHARVADERLEAVRRTSLHALKFTRSNNTVLVT